LIGSALAARKIMGSDGIEIVDTETARSFVELWHYSGVLPTGRNVCFGWFIGSELYAIAMASIKSQHRYLAKVTGLPVNRGNLFVLKPLNAAMLARRSLRSPRATVLISA
jgi:hypothetical protein